MNKANLYEVLQQVALTSSSTRVLIFVGEPLEDTEFQAALVAKLPVEFDYEVNMKGFQGDRLHPNSFEDWVTALLFEAEQPEPVVIFTHRYDIIAILAETLLQKFSGKLIRFCEDNTGSLFIEAQIEGTKLPKMIDLGMELR